MCPKQSSMLPFILIFSVMINPQSHVSVQKYLRQQHHKKIVSLVVGTPYNN